MLLGAGLLTGIAVGAAAGGWWVLAGIVLAGALASAAVLAPPGGDAFQRALRVVVLLALAAMLARVFASYVVPRYPEFAAIAAVVVAAVVAAVGGDVPGYARRMLAAVLLFGAAAFVAVCVAVDPPGVRPAVYTEYPAGWLTSAVALFALFTTLETGGRTRVVLLRIVTGTTVTLAVAWAALDQVGPFRLGLSDTPFADVLVVADAASLRTMLTALVVVVVLPALLAVLAAACRELGTLHDGPAVRFAAVGGIVAAAGAALFSAQLTLLMASTVGIGAALFGWARRWLASRGQLPSGSG